MEIQPWDWSFYADKLKDNRYGVNDEMTRPYFELENVKKGVFGLATELYGLQFVPNPAIQVYHPEVEAFDVLDENGDFLSVLYTDFHARGQTFRCLDVSFKSQYMKDGVDNRPHVTIVMNFTRPTESKPALLTFDEVETFLHEFGHALHGMLAQHLKASPVQGLPRLRGAALTDHGELAHQKEYLDRFAFHYETGEKMPDGCCRRSLMPRTTTPATHPAPALPDTSTWPGTRSQSLLRAMSPRSSRRRWHAYSCCRWFPEPACRPPSATSSPEDMPPATTATSGLR